MEDSREKIKPVVVEVPSFADLPSLDDLARLAESTEWLILQASATARVGENGKRSDETKAERERIIRELAPRLPEHQVWDGGFRPDEESLALPRWNAPETLLSGATRICLHRVVTEQALEDHLDMLLSAAAEYRRLANALMRRLAGQLGVDISEFAEDDVWHAHEQLGHLLSQPGSADTDDRWDYFFHGLGCAFFRPSTGVVVEARLGCGDDFGSFDPGFFLKFIQSSAPDFDPLVELFRDWWQNANCAVEFMEKRGFLRLVESKTGLGGASVLAQSADE